MNTKEDFLKNLERMRTTAERTTAKFAESFQTNPLYAFEWSDAAVKATALCSVIAAIEDLAKHHNAKAIRHFVNDEILRRARNPGRSTSVMSNLVEQEVLVAYTIMAELLNHQFDF